MPTTYLPYEIHLTDKFQYDNAVEQFATTTATWQRPGLEPLTILGTTGLSPEAIATTFNAPLVLPGGDVEPPCTTSRFFGTQANFPTNVASFTRKSGGFFGLPIFATEIEYIWIGEFRYKGVESGGTEVPGETQVAMATRSWVEGFENGQGTSPTGNAYQRYSPQASRHQGGMGLACHNGNSFTVTHRHTEHGQPAVNRGWERFYIRLRHPPNVNARFWETTGSISAGQGARLLFTPSGQIALGDSRVGGVTIMDTSEALEENRWYKIDILYRLGAAPDGYAKLYIGGVLTCSYTSGDVPTGEGIAVVQNHNGSIIGDGSVANSRGAWDIDDWVGGFLPNEDPLQPGVFTSRDWNSGSKVVALVPDGPGSLGDYAGAGGASVNDWRYLAQRPASSTLNQGISTNSASQAVSLPSNADRAVDYDPMNLGLASAQMTVSSLKQVGAVADASVNFSIGNNNGTLTLAEGTSVDTRGRLVHTGGLMEPILPLAAMTIGFTCSSTGASAKTLFNMVGQAECIGNFYEEDYVPQPGDPATMGGSFPRHWTNDLHQWPFPDGPWSAAAAAPPSILVNHCGTYVGNGTSQLLTFRTPPTWIFIRNTATNEGCSWLVSGAAARRTFHESTRPSMMPRVYIDPNFAPVAEDDQSSQTIVVIAGNNVGNNSNGVTYQYFCFQDAGQRFAEAGALWEQAGLAVARETLLNNAEFSPEFLLVSRDHPGNASTHATFIKGLGLPTNQLNWVNNAAPATALSMAAGILTLPVGTTILASGLMQIAFMALRRNDGSGDAGIPNVMQLASWTGDGTASRTVSLSPPTGRRPMWAIVCGSNGATRIRDASHTGVTSLNPAAESQDATTGITGGSIDSISVSTALNANGVLYEAWVVPGCSATAGNGGWGVNCESIPVSPIPPSPPFVPPPGTPPVPPTPPPTTGTPTIPPTGTITQCPGPAALIINMALGKIGILKQVDATTLNTDSGVEITAARLHFDEDCKRILRDFPWPFATRYEKLVQVAGPADEADLVQAYSATAYYLENSVVLSGGVLYYALQAHGGSAAAAHPVTDPAYWTTEAPTETNGDWVYAYRAPSLSLFNRRIVNNDQKTRRNWDMDPPDFRVGSDDNGPLIYCDVVNAELEYTILDGCVPNQGDALFREALTWRHACSIAPALTRSKDISQMCWEMYQRLLRDARQSGAQETQQAPQGDPDWITGRN